MWYHFCLMQYYKPENVYSVFWFFIFIQYLEYLEWWSCLKMADISNLKKAKYILKKQYISSAVFLYHDTYLRDCITIYRDMWWVISPLIAPEAFLPHLSQVISNTVACITSGDLWHWITFSSLFGCDKIFIPKVVLSTLKFEINCLFCTYIYQTRAL